MHKTLVMLATLLATAVSRMICPKPLYKALATNYLARVQSPARDEANTAIKKGPA